MIKVENLDYLKRKKNVPKNDHLKTTIMSSNDICDFREKPNQERRLRVMAFRKEKV